MANNNFIKHYLLPDEEVDSLTRKFGQFIMTESGSMYIDKDDNTRIKLGGGGGGSSEPAQTIYIENTTTSSTVPFTKIIVTTTELTDGASPLEDGVLYLVYEAD